MIKISMPIAKCIYGLVHLLTDQGHKNFGLKPLFLLLATTRCCRTYQLPALHLSSFKTFVFHVFVSRTYTFAFFCLTTNIISIPIHSLKCRLGLNFKVFKKHVLMTCCQIFKTER